MAQSQLYSLFDYFKDSVARYPHHLFYSYKFMGSWIEVYYAQGLSKLISAIKILQRYEIKKGDHIGLLSENKPEWILSYLAINALGATAVPVDCLLTNQEITNILIHSDSKLLLTSEKYYFQLQHDMHQHDIPLVNIDGLFDYTMTYNIEDLPKNLPASDMNAIASILYTSGTTGNTKGVMLTQENFASVSLALDHTINITPSDRLLMILPLHHVYSFIGVFHPIRLGAGLIFSESLKSSDILEAIHKGQVSVLMVVPQILSLFYRGILAQVDEKSLLTQLFFYGCLHMGLFFQKYLHFNPVRFAFRKIRLKFGHKFRFFLSGGSKLSPALFEAFHVFGLPIIEGYGLTETSSAVIAGTDKEFFPPGSIGYPLQGIEIKVHEPNADDIGELLVKGPAVMKGYYKNPDLTAQTIQDDWFFTGDLGYQDHKGRFFIHGRLKDIVVLASGKNVYPDELMNYYLSESDLIEEICIFGIESSGQEKVAALIYPKAYLLRLTLEELQDLFTHEFSKLHKGLPSYKTISEWKFSVDPLPKTTTRKFKVNEIRQLYLQIPDSIQQQQLFISAFEAKFNTSPTAVKLKQMLHNIIPDLDESQITYSANLALNLGLDSLNRIDLICGLEREFNLSISDDDAFSFTTVGDIFHYIELHFGSGSDHTIHTNQTLERKYLLNLRNILLNPKQYKLHSVLITFYQWMFHIYYQGLSHIPYQGPYILYTNSAHPLAYFWILSAFNLEVRKSIFMIDNGIKPKQIAPICRKIGNVIKLSFISSNLSLAQAGEYILRNKNILFLQSYESNPNKSSLVLKDAIMLAQRLKCPIIPVNIHLSSDTLANIHFKEQVTVSFKRPMAIGEIFLTNPQFRISEKNIEEKFEEILLESLQ